MKAIILGIDGGTFDLLTPLMEMGLMPNLKKLVAEGSHGILRSTIMPITAPAWSSFATGCEPSKHGVYNFMQPEKTLNDIRAVSSRDIKARTFYEIVHNSGKKAILINMPNTYPPKTDGITITSLLTQGENCIFPEKLKEEYPELESYKITADSLLSMNNDMKKYLKEVREVEGRRFEIGKKLFRDKPWDVFLLHFIHSDTLQHGFFKQLRSGEADPDAYGLFSDIDSYIGWFIDNLPDDAVLMVISDHGFKPLYGFFRINDWLIQKGWLKVREKKEIRKAGESHIEKTTREAHTLRIPLALSKIALRLRPLASPIYKRFSRYLRPTLAVEADLENSIAYKPPPNSYCLYINSTRYGGIVSEATYGKVVDEIVKELKELKDPVKEEHVFRNVWMREEVYGGPYAGEAPDILMELNTRNMDYNIRMGEPFVEGDTNHHAMEGIFFAFGKGVEHGEVKDVNLVDVMPTILFVLDLPIPSGIDGKVIRSIFQHGSPLSSREPKHSQGGRHELDRRISALKKAKPGLAHGKEHNTHYD